MDLKIPSKKKVAVGIALFVSIFCLVSLTSMYFFGGSFSYNFTFFENTSTGASSGHHDPTPTANVEVTAQRLIDGKVVTETVLVGNLITLNGARHMRNIMAFNNETMPLNTTSVIALSNEDALSNTATNFASEVTTNGFARANGTIAAWWNTTGNGNYAWNVTKMFTATDTQQLQQAELCWSLLPSCTYDSFAFAMFTQTTFNSGDNLTIVWCCTFCTNW